MHRAKAKFSFPAGAPETFLCVQMGEMEREAHITGFPAASMRRDLNSRIFIYKEGCKQTQMQQKHVLWTSCAQVGQNLRICEFKHLYILLCFRKIPANKSIPPYFRCIQAPQSQILHRNKLHVQGHS